MHLQLHLHPYVQKRIMRRYPGPIPKSRPGTGRASPPVSEGSRARSQAHARGRPALTAVGRPRPWTTRVDYPKLGQTRANRTFGAVGRKPGQTRPGLGHYALFTAGYMELQSKLRIRYQTVIP